MRRVIKNEKAITLIALVITILVLLILAGISISTLTGDNSIISQGKKAKEDTEIAEEKETIELSAIQAAGKDNFGEVTEENFKQALNNNIGEDSYSLRIENDKFIVTYEQSKREYWVDKDGNLVSEEMYSIPGVEDQIADTDLFDYEIISESEKTARITRIKPQYCNMYGYNPDTGEEDLTDTNYEIKYEGITDTLVIPYQVEINNEIYKITEVNLSVGTRASLPNIETIIYPNTVKRINTNGGAGRGVPQDSVTCKIKKIIFPNKLEEIPDYFLAGWNGTEIEIPNSVTTIGDFAFYACTKLTQITIPSNVTTIEHGAFYCCYSLKSITIPTSVTNIEHVAFLTFSGLITVNYTGTEEQWNQINIVGNNDNLINATINYNYTGE